MVFSSPVFLFLFLPILLGLHFLLRTELRNLLLLTASLLFYSWGEGRYIAILLGSTAANYLLGLSLGRARGGPWAGAVMALAVVVNLGLLASFKYANFIANGLNQLFGIGHGPAIHLSPVHLPLGISFFTFHALSYVIDVFRGEVPPLKNPVTFALYISFFPQSIAGPIVRYGEVARQLVDRVITCEGLAWGVRRFIIGLAKKMLIANTLSVAADAIFAIPPHDLTIRVAWLGAVCYTLQIYFDFSGYSDMAIGLARMFGFQFPENFNYPYVSRSVTEFWRRWHISLSTWFRDYLYVPLGGNRRGPVRLYCNLLTVFVLCGLWHGASWTFVLWGMFHGTFLIIERWGLSRLIQRSWSPIRHAYALVVVMTGWILFRAPTMQHALAFLAAMFGFAPGTGTEYHLSLYLGPELALALVAGMVGALPVVPFLERARDGLLEGIVARPRLAPLVHSAFALTGVMGLMLLLAGSAMQLAAGTYNPFIYFRF
jgi:alginate O-acetyltransferase complex protein AlgI